MKTARLILVSLVLVFVTVIKSAEELGMFEKPVARQMIERRGYKKVEITASEKSPHTEDGKSGWTVIVQFVDASNKTYIARIWVDKMWTEGRVISVTEV